MFTDRAAILVNGLHSADLANVLWLYLSLHYYVVLLNWLTESGFKKWADHGDSRT